MTKQLPTRKELCELPNDAMLSPEEATLLMGLKSPVTLARYRRNGDGPTYTRVGGFKVRYSKADVLDWLKSRRFRDRGHELDEAAKRAAA
jgi:hypothetical protein